MSEEEQRGQNYRAVCYFHQEVAFPVRADRLDAEEDKNTHIHRPGSHHVDVLTVDFLPTDVEGFPTAGYARELGNQIQRAMQHLTDQPHHDEDGQTSAMIGRLKESKTQKHVETLALAWAEKDGLESWMLAAPDARPFSPATLNEIVVDYLAWHDPFPDGMSVEVARRDGSGWDPAGIVGRPGTDEWTVEYEDGTEAWRDHIELRPRR